MTKDKFQTKFGKISHINKYSKKCKVNKIIKLYMYTIYYMNK